MRQKYVLTNQPENDVFIISEYAEFDKQALSLLCEEKYSLSKLKEASEIGDNELVNVIRTQNFFPPSLYARTLAETIKRMILQDEPESTLSFNDTETLGKMGEDVVLDTEAAEDETADLEELLDEEMDEEFDDDMEITNLNDSLKIADDDSVDLDEDP